MDSQQNHRQSFRINDRVAILVRSLNRSEIHQLNSSFELRRRELAQAPGSDPIADYKKHSVSQIQKRCPEAHNYISYLEEKIEKLERNSIACESLLPMQPSSLVNLSTSGIQFQSEIEYLQDSLIEIAIRLFPSQAALLFFAKVTRSEAVTDAQSHTWGIGASYTHIHQKDKETLAHHIHQYQIDALSLQITANASST
jgi:hypothetical protein